MNDKLYELLAARAGRRCECGACGRTVPPGEVDHFFGRAKAEELESTCWILTPECHAAKTAARPTAAHWLLLFINFCTRYRYEASRTMAEDKLAWLRAKRTSGEAA